MKYIFGNWKMYLGYGESLALAQKLKAHNFEKAKINIAVFPSPIATKSVADILSDSSIDVGAQDVMWLPQGAYTGAVSAKMYKDIGCTYTLIGHSERRHIFGERNADVRKKIENSLDEGLVPVLCIGETQEDKEQDKRQYRLKKQLLTALDGLNLSTGKIIIAYEPVWAIGTGEACLPEDAEDIIGWIKQEVKTYTTDEIPVLYGGSVNAKNVLSYTSIAVIDGVLIGGASTKYDEFTSIITSVSL